MPFTAITKPAVGDPTKKSAFADLVVDDLNFLYNLLLSTIGSREIITNGSFESDVDADSIPDNWTRTLYDGSSTFSHETSTSAADGKSIHGKRSVKFTSTGTLGGGYITNTDFFEISEKRYYMVGWTHKSSVATIRNLVEISWYDSTQAFISTSTLYDSTANPTAWTLSVEACEAPANARYAKLTLTGAKNGTAVAGSAWFDDVRIGTMSLETQAIADGPGGGTWKAPTGVYFAEFICIGGGGGGGASNGGNGGGGGGGAGYCRAVLAVTPGTSYVTAIGAGGVGAASSNGTAGGNTSIVIGATTLLANGGSGGVFEISGGAGGTASGGDVNTSGGAGGDQAGGVGGAGGIVTPLGVSATGTAAGTPVVGQGYGAGGAGSGGVFSGAGANGYRGALIIRW